MKKLSPTIIGLIQTIGVILYCSAVVFYMNNLSMHTFEGNDVFGGLLVLLLFIISALITASLVLGYPLWLFFVEKDEKKKALMIVANTIAWLFLSFITIVTGLLVF